MRLYFLPPLVLLLFACSSDPGPEPTPDAVPDTATDTQGYTDRRIYNDTNDTCRVIMF